MVFEYDDNYGPASIAVILLDDNLPGRNIYSTDMLALGGQWNHRLKGKRRGWIFPKALKDQVLAHLDTFSKKDQLVGIETHMKSRHEQDKYHRAVSDSEEEEEVKNMVSYCEQFSRPPPQADEGTKDDDFPDFKEDEEKVTETTDMVQEILAQMQEMKKWMQTLETKLNK
jgi:hypothetical protein